MWCLAFTKTTSKAISISGFHFPSPQLWLNCGRKNGRDFLEGNKTNKEHYGMVQRKEKKRREIGRERERERKKVSFGDGTFRCQTSTSPCWLKSVEKKAEKFQE